MSDLSSVDFLLDITIGNNYDVIQRLYAIEQKNWSELCMCCFNYDLINLGLMYFQHVKWNLSLKPTPDIHIHKQLKFNIYFEYCLETFNSLSLIMIKGHSW